jgi:hypothetical protein
MSVDEDYYRLTDATLARMQAMIDETAVRSLFPMGHRIQMPFTVKPLVTEVPTVSIDDMVKDILTAKELLATRHEQPEKIRVADDLFEQLKARATETSSHPLPAHLGHFFGIPVEVDEDLEPGEFKVDYR